MERSFIEYLQRNEPADDRVPVGIGDDAAVIRLGGDCVAAVDMITDEVDFILAECDPQRIGRKALAVNLSDMAAMAARPVAALVSLLLPREGGGVLAKQLYAGMAPLARQYSTSIAGGDTNSWNGKLAISVTVLGEPTPCGLLRRSGAQQGDHVLVTGDLGGSILGKHFDFMPRVEEAITLRRDYQASAAADISDGLLIDLDRLTRASSLGVELDLEAIPISAAARELAARVGPSTALDHALADGEDFELIFTAPPRAAEQLLRDQPLGVPVTRIGVMIARPGLWRRTPHGREALEPRGFEHRFTE
ncbi:thiamine-phosphate kinase [Lignipirellula cremea]|uniref:Thiamine-monophosphate kinase n=1 Tax=Lignipirellula cremea TaxID=2528010 RepID=A0A518DW83_9BACT|nr:thiamine-phosphate kinase [Lignipirellula cremea]QDU96096.1 Thiamine-monophosphate kinase [Lignipirellula cremea]